MSKLNKENVVDILPLSPVQEGILFHFLYAENQGEYFQQTVLKVSGELSGYNLQKAMQIIVDKHEGLRTIFRWENLKKPLQIILKKYKPVVRFIDNGLSIGNILEKDKKEGIQIEENPYRLSVINHNQEEHTFIFSFHHILLDGWSFGILLEELLNKYHQLINNKEEEPKVTTNGAIKTFLHQNQQRSKLDEANFWKKNLSTYTSNLELPYKESRKDEGSDKYATFISSELTSKIKRCSKKHKISIASIYYAAWTILLNKTSNNSSITFGTTTSGRTNKIPNINNAIGLFINTLPFHVYIEKEATIVSVLKYVQENIISIQENQHAAIQELKGYLQVDSKSELFNSLMVIENYPLNIGNVKEGLKIESSEVYENNNYEITVTILPFDIEKTLHFSFKKQYFSKKVIQKIANHLKTILAYIVEFEDKKVGELELVNEEDRRLLSKINSTEEVFPDIKILHEILIEKAQITPEKVALRFKESSITYSELNELSSKLACKLKEKGVREGDVVGVYMDRSIELLVSIFAVFKSGGVYLPIALNLPKERVKFIINDSKATYILKQNNQEVEDISEIGYVTVDLKKLSQSELENITFETTLSNVAYIIYTSGSTGTPKGVEVTHSALMNGLNWVHNNYKASSEDVFMLKTPIVFDVSLWELFWWVLEGASLCILPPNTEKEIDTLVQYIEDYDVSHLFMVPTLLRGFTEYVSNLELKRRVVSLKRIIASGETLKVSDVNRFNNAFDELDVELSNLYGPTEASVHVSNYNCPKNVLVTNVPIGKPIANTKFYVLDNNLKIMPVGLIGELYIGGENLAARYINQEQLTKKCFIENPFGEGRLYKTGDLVKWNEEGSLLFLGRVDAQVKLRGYRIELGEIEACLIKHNSILDVVVQIINTSEDNSFLSAFCVVQDDFSEIDVRNFLLSKVPTYMVPEKFHIVNNIPVTHNGKVDKEKLKSIVKNKIGKKEKSASNEGFKTETLKKLIAISEEVLKKETIKIDDDFFQIGGDSIKAIRLLSLLRKEEYEVSMKDILNTSSFKELSITLEKRKEKVIKRPFIGEVDINPIQSHFFSIDDKVVNQYNQAAILKLNLDVTLSKVKEILEVISLQHDIFRVFFEKNDKKLKAVFKGDVFNYIIKENKVPENSDLSIVLNQLHTNLDITEGPLVIFSLTEYQGGEFLLIVAHHLIIDGVSWRILLEDLQGLLKQDVNNEVLSLPAKSQSFGDYINTIKKEISKGTFQKELTYWKQNIVESNFKFNPEQNEYLYRDFSRITKSLSKKTSEGIELINRKVNTNANDVFVTALSVAINKVFNIDYLTLNLEGHGRTEFNESIDIDRTLGWFTSLYPVSLPRKEFENELQYLRIVKECLRGVPNNGEGYGVLKYMEEEIMNEFIPEVSFNHMGDFSSLTSTEFFTASTDNYGEWYNTNRKVAHVLEVFSIQENSKTIKLTIDFIEDLINQEQIKELQEHIEQAVLEIASIVQKEAISLKTPSDFTFKNFSMKSLDNELKNGLIKDIYELSPTQEGILYQYTGLNDTNSYVVNASLYLNGNIDKNILEQAYTVLVNRHDSLRTIFTNSLEVEETLQVVKEKVEVSISFWDMTETNLIDIKDGLQKIDKKEREEISNIFSKKPNIRLNLSKLSDKEFRIGFYYHHILLDGWSVTILFNELFQIYELISDKKNLQDYLQPAPVYSFYLKWLKNQNLSKASSYWGDYLKNFSTPFHFQTILNENTTEKDLEYITCYINEKTVSRLHKIMTTNKGTLYNYLQAAWGMLISNLSGINDVVFGQVVSGRPSIDYVDKMVGLFINTIPKRVQLTMEMTFIDLVNSIVEDELKTSEYHHYPLADILSKTPYREKLFSYIVTFENQYQLMESLEGEFYVSDYEGNDPNNYDLNVFFFEEVGKLKVQIRYCKNKYQHNYLVDIIEAFEALLSKVVQNINEPIEEVLIDITGDIDLPLLL